MVNNELEIVPNNPVEIPVEVSSTPVVKPNTLKTVATVGGSFAAGMVAAYGIYKVVEFLIKRKKAKKAEKIEVEEAPKTEE